MHSIYYLWKCWWSSEARSWKILFSLVRDVFLMWCTIWIKPTTHPISNPPYQYNWFRSGTLLELVLADFRLRKKSQKQLEKTSSALCCQSLKLNQNWTIQIRLDFCTNCMGCKCFPMIRLQYLKTLQHSIVFHSYKLPNGRVKTTTAGALRTDT